MIRKVKNTDKDSKQEVTKEKLSRSEVTKT